LAQALHGKVEVENFPPCFSELYSHLDSGQQLNHLGNFALATFLIAISMPRDKILELYKKAPNFDEKISSYHIDRMMKGKKYTPASCNTMRSYDLCIQNGALCPSIKNPLQYYRRKIFSKSEFKASSVEAKEVIEESGVKQ
jgi:DNA primase large subunit